MWLIFLFPFSFQSYVLFRFKSSVRMHDCNIQDRSFLFVCFFLLRNQYARVGLLLRDFDRWAFKWTERKNGLRSLILRAVVHVRPVRLRAIRWMFNAPETEISFLPPPPRSALPPPITGSSSTPYTTLAWTRQILPFSACLLYICILFCCLQKHIFGLRRVTMDVVVGRSKKTRMLSERKKVNIMCRRLFESH